MTSRSSTAEGGMSSVSCFCESALEQRPPCCLLVIPNHSYSFSKLTYLPACLPTYLHLVTLS